MTDTDQLKSMISGLATKTIYGQLEPLMPEIDKRIKEGVPRAEIHELIRAQGIEISQGTFYNYLHRYRKRNQKSATPRKAENKTEIAKERNGNSAIAVPEVIPEPDTIETESASSEPSLDDLLKNEKAREEYTDQFMTRPPRRKKT